MSRTEKVIVFIVSALVFAGLFYFILIALRTPPSSLPLGEPDYYGAEDEGFDFDEELSADSESVTPPAPTPSGPTPKPASPSKGQ